MREFKPSFANTCFSACVVLAGSSCNRTVDTETREQAAGWAPVDAACEVMQPATPASEGGPTRRVDADEKPVAAKSVGHTSFVLKLTMADGSRAIFKPRSRRPLGDRRYRGEIAAYRLARALGLDNVPPAAPRAFSLATLRAAFSATSGESASLEREVLVDSSGSVRGALIDWIDDYRTVPLEEPAWRNRWESWLTNPHMTIPDDQQSTAAAISTMVAFDYITANWDRWSGGNVAQRGTTGSILFVDNDGAFFENPPDSVARQLDWVRRIVRFSRRFVKSLREFDEAKLTAVLGDESPGQSLLPQSVVHAAEMRRRSVIEAIDARVTDAGAAATLDLE